MIGSLVSWAAVFHSIWMLTSVNMERMHGRPQEGARGSPDPPLDFDINFSHIITVAPRVEIQMHF